MVRGVPLAPANAVSVTGTSSLLGPSLARIDSREQPNVLGILGTGDETGRLPVVWAGLLSLGHNDGVAEESGEV